MKLFIAEKPELARAIAGGLNGNYRFDDGYIEKGDNLVTWAFGHVLALAEPQAYNPNYEKWNLADLPFQIGEFKYVPIKSSVKQLKIICDLIKRNDVDEIVHCGDPDDEGQILIDEILTYAKNSKPVSRVLINDNTEKSVKVALGKIEPNSKFKGLSERGFARSQADWIVGLNLTRAFTTYARSAGYNEVLSLGRVQTPILSLVVSRDNEHENFKSVFYYTINGEFNVGGYSIRTNLKTDEKIGDENIANRIKSECERGRAVIDFIKTEHKSENPPLPYSLLKLQVDCSKILGLKPDKTLELTQSLREKYKAITYNRSDCEYLPTTLWENAGAIIDTLMSNFRDNAPISEFIAASNTSIKSVAFNDENITAHHAIAPTAQNLDMSALSKDELSVYTLIVKRFLAQFFEKKEFDSTNIQISINDNKFVASQVNVTKHTFDAFLKVESTKDKDQNDEEEVTSDGVDFRRLNESDDVLLRRIEMTKKKTNPKPYYTMATLLEDLTGVAKYAKDEKIKRLLLEKDKGKKGENGGIGTPATRSVHLANLVDKGYIEVSSDKKQIIKSTLKGKSLIKYAPSSLTSADMTALWFEMQKEIEAGNLSRDDFLKDITNQVKAEIDRIKGGVQMSFGEQIKCPTCGKGFLRRRQNSKDKSYFWSCSEWKADKSGCNAIFPDEKGKPNFNAKSKQEQKTTGIKCPQCGKGVLVEYRGVSKTTNKPYTMFSCSEWKNGCNFRTFADKSGKPKLEANL